MTYLTCTDEHVTSVQLRSSMPLSQSSSRSHSQALGMQSMLNLDDTHGKWLASQVVLEYVPKNDQRVRNIAPPENAFCERPLSCSDFSMKS